MHEPPLSHNPSTFKRWIHCRGSSNRKLSAHNSAAAISNGCGVMIRRPLARTSRGGNGVSRLASAGKREHSPRRNPLWHRAIVAGEGVGLGMGARENPGVTNFATPGFKWRGQDSNLRPRGYEPRELPGCSTPRQCFGRLGLLLGGSGRSSVWRMNSQEKTQCWSA